MAKYLLLVYLSLISALHKQVNSYPEKTHSPVIGILTLPLIDSIKQGMKTNASQHIVTSYVQFLEMSGARVVPIFSNSTQGEIDQLLTWVNGILFTGGDYPFWLESSQKPVLTPEYASTGCYIFTQVQKLYSMGEILPLWATCLGHELIHVCVRNEFDTISDYTGMPPYSQKQVFTKEASESAMFGFMIKEIREIVVETLQKNEVSALAHRFGISPETYKKSSELRETFNILSYMKDKEGKEFVAIVEAKDAPIFGMQFHPEKNPFEFMRDAFSHDSEAIFAMTYFSNFIVSLCKKNGNVFPSDQLEKRIIYNYPPKYINNIVVTAILFD